MKFNESETSSSASVLSVTAAEAEAEVENAVEDDWREATAANGTKYYWYLFMYLN